MFMDLQTIDRAPYHISVACFSIVLKLSIDSKYYNIIKTVHLDKNSLTVTQTNFEYSVFLFALYRDWITLHGQKLSCTVFMLFVVFTLD